MHESREIDWRFLQRTGKGKAFDRHSCNHDLAGLEDTMAKNWTEEQVTRLLDWAYDTAISVPPPFDSAEDLANDYSRGAGSLVDDVNSLIRWQNTKAATSGFLSGLGGLITLPIAIPVNFGAVLVIHVRMIAAIAIMGGYDVKDDRVKTLAYVSLVGNSTKEILRSARSGASQAPCSQRSIKRWASASSRSSAKRG